MANRCPDCNKFVSLEAQAEIDTDPEIEPNGEISGSIRLFMTCAECGTEMSESILDFELTCDEAAEHIKESEGEHELSIEVNDDPEPSDRYETVDRKGKPIKNSRYQKHYYFATLNTTISCACGESWEFNIDAGEVQASGMDELI